MDNATRPVHIIDEPIMSARHDEGPAPSSTTSAIEPLLHVDVTSAVGPGYTAFFEDVTRMVCIQLTIQLMIYFGSAERDPMFFTADFLVMLTYIVLGVALYWLVIKRVVVFK